MPVRRELAMEADLEEENNIPIDMIQNIQNSILIKNIERRLFNIEQCYFNPPTLTLQGYEQLRNTPGQHWKARIYTLFCDAYLPHYWILDIWKNPLDDPEECPNTVYIQCITFRAKMFIKNTLTHFFSFQNTSINVHD